VARRGAHAGVVAGRERRDRVLDARQRGIGAYVNGAMDVLVLLVFVSSLLAACAVGLFAWLARGRTFEHADRLALLPIEEDERQREREWRA
jgi:hypothetical protein